MISMDKRWEILIANDNIYDGYYQRNIKPSS